MSSISILMSLLFEMNYPVYRGEGGFNPTYGGSDEGMGKFYTNSPVMAAWFAGLLQYDAELGEYVNVPHDGEVVTSELTLKNPHIIDSSHPEYDLNWERDSFHIYMDEIKAHGGVENYKKRLKALGRDGIILKDNVTNYYEDGTYDIYVKF